MPSKAVKYCISILPSSKADLYNKLRKCKEADIIELRLDLLEDINFYELKQKIDIPLIVTVRMTNEGGFWEKESHLRYPIFQKAINAGIHFIDVEWQTAREILPNLQFTSQTSLILSHHTDENQFDILKGILDKMTKIHADIYKLIYKAYNINDNIISLRLRELYQKEQGEFLIHAMGEEGTLSRLIGAIRGNSFTYLSLEKHNQTASGQLEVQEANDKFYLREKNKETKLIGLLGYPITQSKGWQLHNTLLHEKRNQIKGQEEISDFLYVNFSAANFDEYWQSWSPWVDGLSITIPHKESIIPHLSTLTKFVEKSGVCNTAIKVDNKWLGYNTDVHAVIEVLKPYVPSLSDGVLLYGTGATTRSTIAALKELNIFPIYVIGRNKKRGKLIQKFFNVKYIPDNQISRLSFSGIIQTTPVGMFPYEDQIPPISNLLDKVKIVFDVVYNPPMTKLLEKAKEAGCLIISGEEMFLRQAMKQFEIFCGINASLADIKRVWQKIMIKKESFN